MALVDNAWYIDHGDGSTTGYWALTKRPQNTAVAAGVLRRQFTAPSVGNERVFACIVAGTTQNVSDATWTLTRGAKTTDGSVTWQECTGIAALNGDATNTPSWTITATPPGGVKNTAVTLGQVIKRDSGASYQICTTAGTAGNGAEPAFSNTAGVTTNDNTVVWTSLGVVGGFSIFGCPHARLANAFASTWGQAGNSFFIKSTSAETQATAMTLTSPGSAASPCFVYSVGTGATPPTSTTAGASISTTLASGLNINGFTAYDGVTFSAGSVANAAAIIIPSTSAAALSFKNCSLVLNNTSASSGIFLGVNAGIGVLVTLDNTPMTFGATGQSIQIAPARIKWLNTASALGGATFPTTLFVGGLRGAVVRLLGVDLSALGAGNTIVGAQSTAAEFFLQDCKLGASVTVAATPASQGNAETYLVRSDSSGTNYRHEKYAYAGTQTVETTIVRTGGASDGATPLAWKIVPTANCKWALPFECIPITIWNDTISPTTFTVTIYGIWSGGAVPTNADVWMDVEYLGASGTPLGSFSSGTKASNIASNSSQTSDGSTWGGSTTAFKMVSASITALQKGWVNIFVKVGASSGTIYIDPKPVLT